MKISRLSPFVVSPASEAIEPPKKSRATKKVIKASETSAHSKDHETSDGNIVSAVEFVKRRREQEAKKDRYNFKKRRRILKRYLDTELSDSQDLMKDNYNRKA